MKKISKILIAMLTLCLAFALTGCSDKKAEKQYYDDVQEIQTNLTTINSSFLTDLQTFASDVTNEDTKKACLDDIKKLEDELIKLRDITAPKKYKEAQVVFKEAAEEALKGTEPYRSAVEACTEEIYTDEAVYTSFIELITEGDEFMATATTKMSEAVNLVNTANK
ncbi:hypothetical protein [Anaerosporobacter sp.]|uniref:hypothetical protein n=1 Tax=Anaerosporobacter sp. TaxID=1872529 RepID=UPI00286F7BBD|nr:hypothetical protein [Anaerosporobacter sp.]